MPTVTYTAPGDISFPTGSALFPVIGSWFFNPSHPDERSDSLVTYVRWYGTLRAEDGGSVDLGKVTVWLDAPSGFAQTIYSDGDFFGDDTDEDEDSDSEDDHDLEYDGTGAESRFDDEMDGRDMAGEWELRVRNGSGEDLVWEDFRADITFVNPARPDLVISDIKVEGQMEIGETVTIKADVSNITNVNYTDGFDSFEVEYYVNDSRVGSDTIDLGFLAGLTLEYEQDFTVTSEDPAEIRVEITGTSGEESTDNNSRTEYIAQDHSGQKTIANSAEEVGIGAFLARAVYGDLSIPGRVPVDGVNDQGAAEVFIDYNGPDNDDNGRDDDYRSYLDANGWTLLDESDLAGYYEDDSTTRFQSGGLYEGKSSAISLIWEAQGLLMEGTLANGDTALVYGFRGTDGKDTPLSLTGQAWTGNGLFDHYMAHRPIIEAFIDYANDPSNGIDALIVSGHSLGGSMVDIFSAVDAQRVRDEIDLTAVALAPAGIDEDVYTDPVVGLGINPVQILANSKGFRDYYDPRVVETSGLAPGLGTATLTDPDYYIGIAHNLDGVTHPDREVTIGNSVLLFNKNYDGNITDLVLPGIVNDDKAGTSFGAHHDQDLYWTNLQVLTTDPLVSYLGGHEIIMGRSDYTQAPDLARPNRLDFFPDYIRRTQNGDADDRLVGDNGSDYILGLAGNDLIYGGGGNDLLSGGSLDVLIPTDPNQAAAVGVDDDRLYGGGGNDRLSGGDGADTMYGDSGSDSLMGGRGADRLFGNTENDWISGGWDDDSLDGGTGDDTLMGNRGADYLNGGAGNDTLNGGLGNDFYIVGAAGDVIEGEIAYSAGGGIDTVRTYVQNYVQPDNIELVRLASVTSTLDLNATGNDAPGTLVGNAGDNSLTGRGGNDQINGNGGDDILIGNTGRDTLVGGAGADRFIYTSISESRAGAVERDVINGFDRGADRIDLAAIDADLTRGGNQAFSFIGTDRFTGTAGELRLQGVGGPNAVIVEADLRGDGVADFQLFVNLTTVLGAGDFIL